mgnify:CR=1 FL=1
MQQMHHQQRPQAFQQMMPGIHLLAPIKNYCPNPYHNHDDKDDQKEDDV